MATPIPSATGSGGSDVTTEVADLLQAVAHRLRREARGGRRATPATWAQMRALRALARRVGPTRMSELADALHIARRSATSVVDELEQRGLVVRGRDPHDRRAVTVEVTRAGQQLLAEARDRRRAATAGMLGSLTDAELRTLRDLLARIVESRAECP